MDFGRKAKKIRQTGHFMPRLAASFLFHHAYFFLQICCECVVIPRRPSHGIHAPCDAGQQNTHKY
jgi:hypothetical protein